ncbi:MAG: glycosyltransferase family 2 protein [Clostridia bacterium]|nr:glycosyltransferase family 2 protein [Clostridia bacterium]
MDYKYKISVIVPCYNSEKFLKETLDNLLGQTLREIQVIAVNDGSKDSTADIIAEYAAKDSRILSVYQENAGVSAARNNGLQYVEGKYTIFADSDDLMSTDALEKLYNHLEEKKADVAICRVEYFGYGGKRPHPESEALAVLDTIDIYDKRILWNFLVSNKCYRSSFLKTSGITFPLKRYAEDGAFCMQILYKGAKIIGVPDATMFYRKREPADGFSVTQSVNYHLVEDLFDCINIIADAAKESFDKPDCTCKDTDEYIQELYRRAYSTFVNSLYRLVWSADKKTVSLMKLKYEELVSKLTPESKKKIAYVDKDLEKLFFSKSEIASNPFISVISESPSESFVNSLYNQSMPYFELITTADLERENVVTISEKSFKKNAEKVSKGKIIIVSSGKKPITDSRLFKVITLLKRNKYFRILPDFVIRIGAAMFLKFKK